jgi:hypothetical protein
MDRSEAADVVCISDAEDPTPTPRDLDPVLDAVAEEKGKEDKSLSGLPVKSC